LQNGLNIQFRMLLQNTGSFKILGLENEFCS
jgi:hypothetical protein